MSDPEAPRRLFRNARREALIVVAVWLLALVWTVGYCYLFGYQHDPDQPVELKQIGGFPDWVFWGIIVPWLLCSGFTVWFAVYGMTDDDLGAEAQEEHGHGH